MLFRLGSTANSKQQTVLRTGWNTEHNTVRQTGSKIQGADWQHSLYRVFLRLTRSGTPQAGFSGGLSRFSVAPYTVSLRCGHRTAVVLHVGVWWCVACVREASLAVHNTPKQNQRKVNNELLLGAIQVRIERRRVWGVHIEHPQACETAAAVLTDVGQSVGDTHFAQHQKGFWYFYVPLLPFLAFAATTTYSIPLLAFATFLTLSSTAAAAI